LGAEARKHNDDSGDVGEVAFGWEEDVDIVVGR
jgi:hypothetical protein